MDGFLLDGKPWLGACKKDQFGENDQGQKRHQYQLYFFLLLTIKFLIFVKHVNI